MYFGVHSKLSQQQVVCGGTNHGTASVGVTNRNQATILNEPVFLKMKINI